MLQEGLVYFTFDHQLLFVDQDKEIVKVLDNVSGFPVKVTDTGKIIASRMDGSIGQAGDNNQLFWLSDQGEQEKGIAFPYNQHHDFIIQPEGIILLTGEVVVHDGLGLTLYDDRIVELDQAGNVVWEWLCSDHLVEFALSSDERLAVATALQHKDGYDWAHLNAISLVGENKWYDAGDIRFRPDNILVSSRQLNSSFMIDKTSKKIVWELGRMNQLADESVIIGQHNTHMIAKGLPGEGNILLFDNGGYSGYGYDPKGQPKADVYKRDYSRIIEIDPISLEVVWEFTYYHLGLQRYEPYGFYSPFGGSVQRLPNGNTFCTLSCSRRILEITLEHEVVWDYTFKPENDNGMLIYRAYKIPKQ